MAHNPDIPAGAYYIMAHRSSSSIFGAASSPSKVKNEAGDYVIYSTFDKSEAEAKAADMNARIVSLNVSYTVEHNGAG